MKRAEEKEIAEQFLNIYAGILWRNSTFEKGASDEVKYVFDRPEYKTLNEKYGLEKIAGQGSDFARAKRLLHYLSPRLRHQSMYDNHVPCNALDLLEYSLDNPEHGINCLNKSKILAECCLALGIYARRVCIMPYSPYDFDNHVVTEIYDRELRKWIMLDPTTDGLFVDEQKTPLSLLEIRQKFSNDEFVTFVPSVSRLTNLKKLQADNVETNMYICKNLFYFIIDGESTFGESGSALYFVPENVKIKDAAVANAQFRVHHLPEEYAEWKKHYEKQIEALRQEKEPPRTSILSMEKSPV